jgi:viroplasmin and RNaseH domain-containing protein
MDDRTVWVMNANGAIFAAFDSREKAQTYFKEFLKKTYHFDSDEEFEKAVDELIYRGVYIIGVKVQ